ncbi:MAG TPA: sulfotransferase [Solirubrobacteraceae bacterium]|nr:sulfotransferase [Solirubrobacteraceae bacterium]
MPLRVVGAGVGRTGTNSLKLALERLLGGPCHHMFEIREDRTQIVGWTEAIEGRPVDWETMLAGYSALVDWPGASFWPELSAANPDALVLLSVRDPRLWYRSASNTIFPVLTDPPAELAPWIGALRRLLRERFSDRLEDEGAMIEAFERHNGAVREAIAPERLLEWSPGDGWEPICERLGLEVPGEDFPHTNSTAEFRARSGTPAQP